MSNIQSYADVKKAITEYVQDAEKNEGKARGFIQLNNGKVSYIKRLDERKGGVAAVLKNVWRDLLTFLGIGGYGLKNAVKITFNKDFVKALDSYEIQNLQYVANRLLNPAGALHFQEEVLATLASKYRELSKESPERFPNDDESQQIKVEIKESLKDYGRIVDPKASEDLLEVRAESVVLTHIIRMAELHQKGELLPDQIAAEIMAPFKSALERSSISKENKGVATEHLIKYIVAKFIKYSEKIGAAPS